MSDDEVERVAEAIRSALKGYDAKALVMGDVRCVAIDGEFDLTVVARAAIAAIAQPQENHDE